MELKVSEIITDGGTQPRARCDVDRVSEYAADMREGAVFPPVDVFFDGEKYWLADGFHRRDACIQAGLENISVTIHQGGVRDAILFSVSANSSHGIRRTNEDKRRAVMRLLNDAEWGKESSRWIAEHCKVTHPFVESLRSEVVTVTTSDKRQGKDGKMYPASQSPRTASTGKNSSTGGGGVERGEDPGELDPLVGEEAGTQFLLSTEKESPQKETPSEHKARDAPTLGPKEKKEQELAKYRESAYDGVSFFLDLFAKVKREVEIDLLIEWLNEQKESE